MKRWIAMLLALLMLCMAGCGAAGSRKDLSEGTWVTYLETESRVKNEENKDIFVYSYQQPVLNGTAAGIHMINTKLNNATTAFLYGSSGVEEMTELAKMDWRETWFTCYALNREVSVARVDDAVASFRYADYVFTGGIHGYTSEFGVSYDMVSGQQLELADLSDNEWGLKEVCRQHITAYLESDEFPHKADLMENYADQLDTVLKNWVLTDEGLQFIAQPYIISTYVLGTLRFTVPYEKLVHILHEKWIPGAYGHGGGSVEVRQINEQSPGATNFYLDSDGETMLVKVSGSIYDFSIERLNSYTQNGQTVFYIVKQMLYSPKISGEMFGLQVQVPETNPTTMLRYRDGSGEEHQYLIAYDGKNGGVVLTEWETLLSPT